MISRKTLALAGGVVLVAAIAAALLAPPRRTVTTSSAEAYREYRAGEDAVHRMYISDAQRHFEAALRDDPSFVMAMVSLASVRQASDLSASKSWLARANAGRNRVSRRERLVLDLMRAWVGNRFDEATRLAIVLKDDYHDERGFSFLGMIAGIRGQTDDANAIYREWLAVDPNNALAYNQLGYNAAYRGDYAEAVSDLKKYAFLAPDQANPFDSLGEVEAANGRYEDAIRDLKKALAIKPDFYPSFVHLGVAYSGLGDHAAARDALETAVKGYSGSAAQTLGPLLELLTVAHRQDDLALERATIPRALALDFGGGEDPRPLLRALLASDEGRYEEAVAEWSRYAPATGTDEKLRAQSISNAGLLRGRIEFNAGHFGEAVRWIERTLPAPGHEGSLQEQAIALRSRALLARAKARLGDPAAAQALLAVNRRFNPRNPETLSAAEEIARAEVPAGPGRRGAGAEAKTR
jgi:tetratricopeptide (TPR) repeat protein